MKTQTGSKNRLINGIALLFAVLMISISCSKSMNNMYGSGGGGGGGGNGGPAANEVWIQGMAFTPSTITVSAGTKITWTNKDLTTHTVTSDDGLFNSSGNIGSGGIYSNNFATAGTYKYHCSIHPSMLGKVVVN